MSVHEQSVLPHCLGAACGAGLVALGVGALEGVGPAADATLIALGAGLGAWIGAAVPGGVRDASVDGSGRPGAAADEAPAPVAADASDPSRYARAAIEAAPAPVMIVDEAGKLAAANRAARERFAVDAPIQAQGARFATLVRRPELVESVAAVLADGQARSFAFDTLVPVERFERATVAAFEVDGRRHVLVTVADQTEAKVSERMRADFLANASHELRTPLAGIVGFIETLRGPARDDPAARERFLEIMHNLADRMSRLISDLLSLSRIELNEHVAPTGRADLAAAVQEALDAVSASPRARDARIEFEEPDAAVWVVADWDEVQQVVTNLVDNALKYGRAGGRIRLTIDPWLARDEAVRSAGRRWNDAARLPLASPSVERGRRYAVLRVEDEGAGIERQHLPRLSERFYRIEGAAQSSPGTGLGLAIVKHIINRHRGGLMVESQPGRGSAFAIYLRQPDDAAPAPSSETRAVAPSADGASGQAPGAASSSASGR